jgi:hypothetical protein
MRLFALLVACAPAYLPTSGGPCIEHVRWGKSTHYFHEGEELSASRLEKFLERAPDERYAVSEMRNLRRAGWSLVALGYLMLPVSIGVLIGASDDKGGLPTWAEATGGTLLAAWAPTVVTGVVLASVARNDLSDAVRRRNARGPCPDF